MSTPRTAALLVAVYADESCLGNGREGDNPGGAAGVIEFVRPTGILERRDYWRSSPATTNNRMALTSVIEALRILGRKAKQPRIVFTTDSRYVVDGMQEWIHGWIARDWRRRTGAIENLEMWREAAELVAGFPIQWRWVRGHVGHPQNEYANDLAVRAAQTQSASGGAVASGFDAWLRARRQRGITTREPDPFPDIAAFRAARPLPDGATGRR